MAAEGPYVVKKSLLLSGDKNGGVSDDGQPAPTIPAVAAAATAAEVLTTSRDSVTEEVHNGKKKRKRRKRTRTATTKTSSRGHKRKQREDNATTSSQGKTDADDGDDDNDDKEKLPPKKKRKKSRKHKKRSSSVDSQSLVEGDSESSPAVAPTTTTETTTPLPPPPASQRKEPDKDTTRRSTESDKKNKVSFSETSPEKKNGPPSASDAEKDDGSEAPSEDEESHDHKHDSVEGECETPRDETPRSARKKENAKKADQEGISSVVDTPVDVDASGGAKSATPEPTTAAAKANTESSTKEKDTAAKGRRRQSLTCKERILNWTAALQETPGEPVSRELVVKWVGGKKNTTHSTLSTLKKNHLIEYDANNIWLLPEGEEMAQPWNVPEEKPPMEEEEGGRDHAKEKSDAAASAVPATPTASAAPAAEPKLEPKQRRQKKTEGEEDSEGEEGSEGGEDSNNNVARKPQASRRRKSKGGGDSNAPSEVAPEETRERKKEGQPDQRKDKEDSRDSNSSKAVFSQEQGTREKASGGKDRRHQSEEEQQKVTAAGEDGLDDGHGRSRSMARTPTRKEEDTPEQEAPTGEEDGRSDNNAPRVCVCVTAAAPTQRMLAQGGVRAGDNDPQSQAGTVTIRADSFGILMQNSALTAGSRDLSQQIVLQFPWTTMEESSRCRPLRKTIRRNDGTVEEVLHRILTRDVPHKHWMIFGSQYAPDEPRFFIQCGSQTMFVVDTTSELLPSPRTTQELHEAVSFSFYFLAEDGSELAARDNVMIAIAGNDAGLPKYKVAFERGLQYAVDVADLAGIFHVRRVPI